MPALVVFDMAGTTVVDDGQVPAAFVGALAAHGIDVRPQDVVLVRGASKRDAVLRFVPEGPTRAERAALVYDDFRQRLAKGYAAGVRAVAGAEEVFAALRARGIRVALNTGFDRDTAALLLESLGWTSGTIDDVVCGDDVAQGRPAPDLIHAAMAHAGIDDPSAVANVGDTALDLEAGSRAHVLWNIGVTSGAHGRERLDSAPHTDLVCDITEVLKIWHL